MLARRPATRRIRPGRDRVHEVGHWLNLAHTFEGKCSRAGDGSRTRLPSGRRRAGCPIGKDTCSAPGLDPIHYMDLSFDNCYTEFTAGQAARMQDAWLFWRAS